VPRFPTSLGASDPDTITLLGQNLAGDLMGKVGFGELALWLVTQRRPTPSQVRVFEAVLVALADHGFTPTAIAARLTYLSAPDSVQGALAAGLLGGAPAFWGSPRMPGGSCPMCWPVRGSRCPPTTRAGTCWPGPR
jgi:citrate synthase